MYKRMLSISTKLLSMTIPLFAVLTTGALPTRFIPQQQRDDVIRACTHQVGVRNVITMMVLADSCEPGWVPLEWNQQGPPGPPG